MLFRPVTELAELVRSGEVSSRELVQTSLDRIEQLNPQLNAFGDHVADYDHNVVRRFKEAGFVIVGTTTLPEWGILPVTETARFGPTRNPWDLGRTPGGSSGGSAAAVAAGLAAAATGSDSAGSIRVPAACCGLFGLKPQRGRISLMPEREHWFGLSAAGFLTRSVADTALLLDV